MKKKLILLILSCIFLLTTLILFFTSISFYDEEGWKGIDTDRDYLFLFISAIFLLVISILNYINKIIYNKEIKYTALACISLNVIYSFYGILKLLSKGVEEIYSGNKFVINFEDLIIYIIWFITSCVTLLILYINKKFCSSL